MFTIVGHERKRTSTAQLVAKLSNPHVAATTSAYQLLLDARSLRYLSFNFHLLLPHGNGSASTTHGLATMNINSRPDGVGATCSSSKRRKTTGDAPKKATKQKKGKLSKLPDMPLDVLYEIFSKLHPQDLLRISWTTKAFRRVLTSTSCKTVWMNSFACVDGLPTRPDGLNEVEYASLLFNPLCQCCSESRAPLAWALCRRICKNCQEFETACVRMAWEMLPKPCETVKPFSTVLNRVLPTHELSVRPWYRSSWDPVVFLRADVKAFFGRVCADGISESDFTAIIDEFSRRRTKRNEFAAAGQQWEARREAEKDEAKERIKSQRYEKVIEKLKEEGWAEELEKHPSTYARLKNVPGVRITRPLSDKAWKGLKSSVLTWMNDVRTQRIRHERAERILNRGAALTMILATQLRWERTDFFLCKEDICWIPDIKTTITEGSAEEFEGLKSGLPDRLPTLAVELKRARLAALLALLPYGNSSVEKLSLATTWFKCGRDGCLPLEPKSCLVHDCFKQSYSDVSESDRHFMGLVGQPWALCPGTSFYEAKAEFARELILAVGGNPETMTHEAMSRQYRFVRYTHTSVTNESFHSMILKNPDGTSYWRPLWPEEDPLSFGNLTFANWVCERRARQFVMGRTS